MLLLAVTAGCSNGKASSDDGAGGTIRTTSTTVAAVTTTTEAPTTTLPPQQPQASPQKAAAAFVAAWTAGDRDAALAVADPPAVDALFAHPAVAVEQRGCNAPLSGTADCAYGIGRQGLLVVTTRSAGGGGWLVGAANYEA